MKDRGPGVKLGGLTVIRWIAAAALACVGAAGCAQNRGARAEGRVAVVNSVCPIAGDDFGERAVPASLTRTWKGRTIGFCCGWCPPEFDKMSAAEKDKVLALAEANAPGGEPCPDEPKKP